MCEDDDRRLQDCFEIYKNLIIQYAKSYVKDYYMAEDICQETFIRFEEHKDEIRESSTKYWLMTTARNLSLDHLRKIEGHGPVIDLDTALDILSDNRYADVSGIFVEQEAREVSKRVLFRLREEHRNWYNVILMAHVLKMDNSSIGDELGVSAALVSKWKERGKAWLQEAYLIEEQKESGERMSPD